MAREITYRSEADVKKQVKKLLGVYRWFYWMPPANGYGVSGVADIVALRSGVFLAVETKFGKNKLSAMQRGFLDSIRAEDGFAFVVNEESVVTFEAWLKAFDLATIAASKNEPAAPGIGATLIDAMRALQWML